MKWNEQSKIYGDSDLRPSGQYICAKWLFQEQLTTTILQPAVINMRSVTDNLKSLVKWWSPQKDCWKRWQAERQGDRRPRYIQVVLDTRLKCNYSVFLCFPVSILITYCTLRDSNQGKPTYSVERVGPSWICNHIFKLNFKIKILTNTWLFIFFYWPC